MNHPITMAHYNQWVNQKLYAICAEIPDEKRNEDLGAFFKSIHGTLHHILMGDRIWLGRFTQQPFTAKLDEILYPEFDQLQQERTQTFSSGYSRCHRTGSKPILLPKNL